MPDSTALIRFFCCFYLATGFLSAAATMALPVAMVLSMLDILYLAAFLYILLSMTGHRSRFKQTFLAQLGVGALMMFVSVPLLLLQPSVPTEGSLSALLVTLLMFWNLAVMGHIFRHAISVSVFIGALLSVGYLLLSLIIFGVVASNVQ